MTEKRFVIKNERTISDNKTGRNGYVFSWKSDAEEICDLLNQLNDENEQLKKENYELKEDLEHCANQFTNDGKNVLLSLR